MWKQICVCLRFDWNNICCKWRWANILLTGECSLLSSPESRSPGWRSCRFLLENTEDKNRKQKLSPPGSRLMSLPAPDTWCSSSSPSSPSGSSRWRSFCLQTRAPTGIWNGENRLWSDSTGQIRSESASVPACCFTHVALLKPTYSFPASLFMKFMTCRQESVRNSRGGLNQQPQRTHIVELLSVAGSLLKHKHNDQVALNIWAWKD